MYKTFITVCVLSTNRRKHCIEPWMNKKLLTLTNKKNDKYRDWKSTNNDIEYKTKKKFFKTFERIIKENIKKAKRDYYFKTFTAHKNDLGKTWRTTDDTLTLSDPGYFRQLTIRGGGALKAPPPLRSRKLLCQSLPYHTCEFDQVF